MDLKCAHLLIACLNLLEEKIKERFTECLDHHWLDRALHQMIKEKLFPEWFSKEFHYDPLYARLGCLRNCLSAASANALLRMDGTNFHYHLELPEAVTDYLLSEIPFDKSRAKILAEKLGKLLSRFLSGQKLPA